MIELELQMDSQWYSLVGVTVEGSDEGTNYYIVQWRSLCRVCQQPFEFTTTTNIPEGKMRRCCKAHTAPNLTLVSK